jgi:hypothetical protein
MVKSRTKAAFQLRIEQRHVEPNQTHATSAAALIPGFVRGGNQILFVQPRPDVLLGGQLKSLNFSLIPDGRSAGPV